MEDSHENEMDSNTHPQQRSPNNANTYGVLSTMDRDDVEVIPGFSTMVSIEDSGNEVVETGDDVGVRDSKEQRDTEKCEMEDKLVSPSSERYGNFQQETLNADISDVEINQQQSESAFERYHQLKYSCDCGEQFEKSAEVAAHKRWRCKLVVKKLQCEICKARFIHESGLRRHMNHSHVGDYNCSHCTLRFHNRKKLTRHWMESHFDENKKNKTLRCFLCGDESFQGKFEFESHLLAHKYNKMDRQKNIIENLRFRRSSFNRINTGKSVPTLDLTDKNVDAYYRFHRGRNCHRRYRGHSSHDDFSPSNDHTYTELNSPNATPPFQDVHPSRPFIPHHPTPHHHQLPPTPPAFSRHPPFISPVSEPPPTSPFGPFSLETPQKYPCDAHLALKKHWKHHSRMRWKRYFMNQFSNSSQCPSTHSEESEQTSSSSKHQHFGWMSNPCLENSPHPSTSTCMSDPDTSATFTVPTEDRKGEPFGFQVACRFCGQVIEKEKIKHRRVLHKCPMVTTVNHNADDKMIEKYEKLIRLMNNHGLRPNTSGNSNNTSTSGSASSMLSVSNLPDEPTRTGLLDFQTNTKSDSGFAETHSTLSQQCHKPPKSCYHQSYTASSSSPVVNSDVSSVSKTLQAEGDHLKTKNVPHEISVTPKTVYSDQMNDAIMEETRLVIDTEDGCSKSPVFTCLVCHAPFTKVAVLSVHLHAHITHVTAVQKVNEWKQKSFQYLPSDVIEDFSSAKFSCEDSSTDAVSFTTATDSSFQDESNANFSHICAVENFSNRTAIITESEKWMKPHHKRKKNRRDESEVFPCEFCNETFGFKKGLKFHMKEKHKDGKHKLECPVCHKKFSWKSRVQFYERHLSSHYGVTIFKHKCPICEKTFLEKCKLQAHIACHKNEFLHKCHLCGKGYSTKSSLTRHLRQHSGAKPHQCSVCNETFLEKRELVRHMASHTGVPAFACPQCDQGFTLKTSLDMHMKRKHSQLLQP